MFHYFKCFGKITVLIGQMWQKLAQLTGPPDRMGYVEHGSSANIYQGIDHSCQHQGWLKKNDISCQLG